MSISLLLVNDSNLDFNLSKSLRDFLDGTKISYRVIRSNERSYAGSLNLAHGGIQTQYVALMNSDDISGRYRLIRQIIAIEEKNADMCIGNLLKFKGFFILPALGGKNYLNDYSFELLLLGPYGADASILMRSDIWESQFKFDKKISQADWDISLRLYSGIKVVGARNAKYFYRIHRKQVSKNNPEGFSQIYSNWRLLSLSLGLPDVTLEVAKAIAAPWEKVDKDMFIIHEFENWASCFLSLFSPGPKQRKANSLIRRRRVILFAMGIKAPLEPRTFLVMAFEFILLFLTRSLRG